MTGNFLIVGELVLSSSGKTVKIYQLHHGKRVLVGQVNRQVLRDLIEKRCLTAHLTKYENISGDGLNGVQC